MTVSLIKRIQWRLWGITIKKLRFTPFYYILYLSYWHYLLNKSCHTTVEASLFYSARPNPGAGIGHQMANWIAGYWFANKFGLKHAHMPFAQKEWDTFLGFGEGEDNVCDLKSQGYKVRKLPLFDEFCPQEVKLQREIIASYTGKKVVLRAEQDQYYKEQFGVMDVIKRKFYSAPARQNDQLIYDHHHFNIAIHVRRGDIMIDPKNSDLVKRFLSNQYFYNVLKNVISMLKEEKKEIHIYFFSQGTPDDFPEFKEFQNLHWCFDMTAQQSFLHMVFADLLITSRSSFSYKPGLISNGIKVCPKDFWHGYPDSDDWILCDHEGNFIKR